MSQVAFGRCTAESGDSKRNVKQEALAQIIVQVVEADIRPSQAIGVANHRRNDMADRKLRQYDVRLRRDTQFVLLDDANASAALSQNWGKQLKTPAPQVRFGSLAEAPLPSRIAGLLSFGNMGSDERWILGTEVPEARLGTFGRYRQRSRTAAEAIADLESSKALARAREAVELAVANDKFEQQVSPDIAEARKARKEVEQGWQKAIDKIAERANLTKGPGPRRQLLHSVVY
jgi:hypothetical protein